MRRTAFSLTLFLGLLLLLGCDKAEDTALRGGTDHLPLANDRTLKYQERIGGKLRDYTIRLRYAGGKRVRVFSIIAKGIDIPNGEFISDSTQVYFSTTLPVAPISVEPEYRELWVNEDAEQGESWDQEVTAVQTVFAGYEDVTVPAGKFKNCYKTVSAVQPFFVDTLKAWRARGDVDPETYELLIRDNGLVTVRWFAAGVGLVKEQIGSSDHVRELVEIVKEGTGRAEEPPSDSLQSSE